MRLGIRAHDLGRLDAVALARRVAGLGLSAVQLAPGKALSGWEQFGPGDLSAACAGAVRQVFAAAGVEIAVLGCYINPIHPDLAERRRLHGWFVEHLRFARAFGCDLVALESGSVRADYAPHPDNHQPAAFAELLDSLGALVAEAAKWNVCVGLEPVTAHTVSTPRKLRQVLDALGSRHLRVVLDPVNLLCAGNVGDPQRVLAEAIELLGDDIAVIHAKDFVTGPEGLRPVPAGRGELDFSPVAEFVRQCGREVPVLLEETGPAAAGAAADFLRAKFEVKL